MVRGGPWVHIRAISLNLHDAYHPDKPMNAIILQSLNLEKSETRPFALSFGYFFCLLCAYYILRPLRDEMGIAGGIENLPWVFTGTFVTMLCVLPLYGWLSARYPRRRFLPCMYLFFIGALALFYGLFQAAPSPRPAVAQAFFIWVSVFNLFVVSIFWSFMTDVFDDRQAKRLFGLIAAGGTAGAVAGPFITANLAAALGTSNLLLVSIFFLACACACVLLLLGDCAREPRGAARNDEIIGGRWYAGFTLVARSPYLLCICGLIFCYTLIATFLYFQQATIIRDTFADSAERTAVFAWLDFTVNTLTVLAQLFLTGRIVRRIGLGLALAVVPLALGMGLLALGLAPVFLLLAGLQVLRRAGNYALLRPAREMLYVVLRREEKYKAKGFIDTVVYRGGDAISAWLYSGLSGLGLSLGQIAWVAAPVTLLWAWLGVLLGKRQQSLLQSERMRGDMTDDLLRQRDDKP